MKEQVLSDTVIFIGTPKEHKELYWTYIVLPGDLNCSFYSPVFINDLDEETKIIEYDIYFTTAAPKEPCTIDKFKQKFPSIAEEVEIAILRSYL